MREPSERIHSGGVAGNRAILDFFLAFKYPHYRYLWASGLGVTASFQMEMVVVNWLVLEMTNSPAQVGIVAALRFAGMGFAPFFGALTDRFDRTRILIVVRAISTLYTILLATLYYMGSLQVWHIFLVTLAESIARASDGPTRSAMTPDTVGKQALASAVSLQLIGMSVTGIVASLLGGQLFRQIGAGGCFIVIAASFVFACLTVIPIRILREKDATPRQSVWKSTTDGLHYIANDRAVLGAIALWAIANLFTFPCEHAVLPVFAKDVLHVESNGYGALVAAEAAGGLVGAISISVLGNRVRQKGWLLISATVAWPVVLGILATSQTYHASLAILAVAGVARGLVFGAIQFLLLTWSPSEVRGRVMSIQMFANIPLPLGDIISGIGMGRWGASMVLVANAAAAVLATSLTTLLSPQLRQRR